jgi:hypothetical protein
LGFVVELVPEDEPMSEAAPFLAFFADFLLAFFDFFFMPVESLFVVVVAVLSVEPVQVDEVDPVWAKAPNETSAKAESAATIVRIMLISFMFRPGVCRTGGCPSYSNPHAAFFGEIFPAGTGFRLFLASVLPRGPPRCSISPRSRSKAG